MFHPDFYVKSKLIVKLIHKSNELFIMLINKEMSYQGKSLDKCKWP